MIEVVELSKRFGETLAVDRLNFQVADGEILGFLGPNGAGKTTTMRVLTGFFPPTGGSAKVAGYDVVTDARRARASLGYLPENVPLYKDMRVSEYLHFVGGVKGLSPAEAKKQAGLAMEQVGLIPRAGQIIGQLSKGFRQRVGLSQALLGDPPVLILDEPTIGLDPKQIVDIRALIKGFAGNKTVVLSSHILSEVAATCSKVVIINQGRLVAQGTPDMLTTGAAGHTRLRLVCLGRAGDVGPAVERVEQVTALSAQEHAPQGCCAFTLELSGGPEVRARVAEAVLAAGCGLVELSPLAASLEEVFMQLTTSETGSQEEVAA